MRDVAAALAEAHENGFIHRDIKPANIMLCKYASIATDAGAGAELTVLGPMSLPAHQQ